MKVHIFNPEEPIPIIGFLATFKAACDTDHTHEGAAMWVLPHCVHELIDNALNSRMWGENSIALFGDLGRNQQQGSQKLSRLYPDIVNYLLKKFATNQAIDE